MTGLIGRKLGMTQILGEDGMRVPVTVIRVGPCTVVQKRVPERDGYSAVQLGFGERKPKRVSKAYRGHCLKAGKGVFAVLTEFKAADDEEIEVGREFTAGEVFEAGEMVDVSGVTKGRGFSGVVRRFGFAGFPATHGTH